MFVGLWNESHASPESLKWVQEGGGGGGGGGGGFGDSVIGSCA